MPEAFHNERRDAAHYNEELGKRICGLIADGMSLIEVVSTLNGTPAIKTIIQWRRIYPEFGDMYEAAFRDRLEVWSEEILTVSDDSRNDWMDRLQANGTITRAPDPETMARSRLRYDARKWLLSKLHPERYGESMKLDANVNAKVQHSVDPEVLKQLKEMLE